MFFFFSSRRRHTRFSRDWSSDVCSSDLNYRGFDGDYLDIDRVKVFLADMKEAEASGNMPRLSIVRLSNDHTRSEERRVGKECRSRWSPKHERKKARRI